MFDKNPPVPGSPAGFEVPVEEPTAPTDPPPAKPDQREPVPVTATGTPEDLPDGARGPQGRFLTTAQGARLTDTDHSLKAGRRGPTLLQDHHFREKITHFDHERIPERAVHARGAAAHGVFRANGAASKITRAGFLQKGSETRVFVRFSTVLGSRGSADTVRDTRGFATKFYTDEGTFDLVGNNIPVFFIQDAIKFPDIVHAAKPHPDREIPQAQSAHDTFWDFVSLHTEATAHTLWNMSDRGIPRSYRMMEGFGVHTFRLVNADGETSLVKFHWKPRLGVHSLVWEEAQLLGGIDPDFHRRDLADAIESGAYPEWDLGVQVFPDTPEQTFEGIDLLDPTKIVPEELAPVQVIGTMQLNANPTNFFAETEQVAFHPGHLVPGIDVTDDPLLQGRLFSYLDTQLSRLGGPNFGQLPINRPHAPVNDMLRDGMHQTGIHPGAAPYRPNSLGAGCPFLAGVEDAAFIDVPAPIAAGVKEREAPSTFDDHFSQARLFYRSLSEIEKKHVANAYTFELGKCFEQAIKERQLQVLANIDAELCATVAAGLGLPAPEPTVSTDGEPLRSEALSQVGATWPVEGRMIGIVADDSADVAEVAKAVAAVAAAKAVPLVIGPHGGKLDGGRKEVPISRTFDTARSVEYDALLLASAPADPRVRILVDETFRHCKAIGTWGTGTEALEHAAVHPEAPGVVTADDPEAVVTGIVELLGAHRVWERSQA
ncbi:catalase [Rhodococcus ruber Chol-4]|uniref:catalase n=1 Tax=Rhodococcus ruber TaxID=1830 RepID=UPI00034B90E1|nr:catalase [Rhodococcus ruber]KXF84640.1 catalase [Rhodococcus ruber Chol-4]QDC15854.1 catalase [Rhodococcus ruber]